MVMIHTHAKGQGQRSVGSKDRGGRKWLHYFLC